MVDVNEAAAARRAKLTILLDENVHQLKPGLKDAGFKVLTFDRGTPDEKLYELAEGTIILTKNSKDFVTSAVIYDFDIISIEHIQFIDTKQDRTNLTVEKIAAAIRQSQFYNQRGNFLLTVMDDGTYKLDPLV